MAPIWLNGSHPTEADGVVGRVACADYGENLGTTPCCDHHIQIGVKNCGSFYVYYLKPTAACPSAYCAGSYTSCPAGKWSFNGLPPCMEAYPVTMSEPTLAGPLVNGHAFRYKCIVNHRDHHPNVRYEVQWLFDNHTDPNIPSKVLDKTHREFILPGTAIEGHLGHTISCRVRAWYANRPFVHKGPWHQSRESHYAGITITPGKIDVDQKTGESNVTITSTVPIVCDHSRPEACCIFFMVDMDGPKNNLLVTHSCAHKLCTKDWNPTTQSASVTFSVSARKNGIMDGNRPMFLAFEKLEAVGGGPYLGVFNNFTLTSTPITIKPSNFYKCAWSGDPHITGFDGRVFHLYDVGDFTMYHNEKERFEVQSRTVLCNKHAACQCGIVIREQNDVIRINNCAHVQHAPVIETNHPVLRQGTSILRSSDGRTIVVYLPSGRQVKITSGGHYQNVELTVPATDYGKGRGICGTIDGVATNEFTHRNGTPDTNACIHRHRCIPVDFEESWRNENPQSLFEHLPADIHQTQPEPHYCQCDTRSSNTPRINCSVAAGSATVSRCPNCQQVNGFSFMSNAGWSTSRRSAGGLRLDLDEPDTPFVRHRNDPAFWNPTWPTASGVQEHEAEAKCDEAIKMSQLFAHCNHMDELQQEHAANCMEDILFADDINMAEASVAAFTAACQLTLVGDPNNYDRDTDGELMLRHFVTEVCSVSCMRHGSCVNGTCVCDAGFVGQNCQLVEGQAPRLLRIRNSDVCDIIQRPCRKIYMDAKDFEMTDNFNCKVQEILPNNTMATFYLKDPAQFVSGNRLACKLPDAEVTYDRSVKRFAVSVTMDGLVYSNKLTVKVYDSTCQTCNTTDCTLKNYTCLINDLCYEDDDIKRDDMWKMCNSTVDPFQWTSIPGPYPYVTKPYLEVDHDTFSFTCDISNSTITNTATPTNIPDTLSPEDDEDDEDNAVYEVNWLVDGRVVPNFSQMFKSTQTELTVDGHDLGSGSTVECRISSNYVNNTEHSPHMMSNTLSLSP